MVDDLKIISNNFELNVDECLRPSLERQLTGTTKMDKEIDLLPIPQNPLSIKYGIQLIRFYRKIRPKNIGNRCVFEPSCSHYSEVAIRENGLFRGSILTFKRLLRCRPGNGGVDVSCKKEKLCNTR